MLEDRLSFNIVYKRAKETRELEPGMIGAGNDSTDHAGTPGGTSPAGWNDDGVWPEENTKEQWLLHYMSLALQEVVHEMAEWFQLDGKPVIPPHEGQNGESNSILLHLCNGWVQELFQEIPQEVLDSL